MKAIETSEKVAEAIAECEAAPRRDQTDLLTILARRLKFITWFTLGTAVLTAIIVRLMPNMYTAETVVLPPTQNAAMSSALLGQLGGSASLASLASGSLGIRNPGDVYVSLFRGRTVEVALIQRFGLMARYHQKTMVEARIAFDTRSTVTLGVKDGLIRITVTDRDPVLAADIANAYVDEFRKHSANLAITEASQRRTFFQKQLQEADANLASAEEAMKQTQKSTGVLQIDSQAMSLIQSVATLRGQIAAKEVQLRGMRSYATEGNPQLVTAEQQLNELRVQLDKLGGTDANASSDIVVPRSNIPQTGMEFLSRVRDVRYYETIEELIAKQLELAKLDEAREGAVIQVADVAAPPDRKSSPHRAFLVLLGTFLAFVVSVGWVFTENRWKQTFNTTERT